MVKLMSDITRVTTAREKLESDAPVRVESSTAADELPSTGREQNSVRVSWFHEGLPVQRTISPRIRADGCHPSVVVLSSSFDGSTTAVAVAPFAQGGTVDQPSEAGTVSYAILLPRAQPSLPVYPRVTQNERLNI